jgi:hypothetical protein
VWSVVRVPGIAEEDDRRLHRECERVINEPQDESAPSATRRDDLPS